jgi:hypothetical protein
MTAFGEMERRLAELRFIDGIEKVEHVPFSTGDQFWVRFNRPIDLKKLREVISKDNYQLVRFGSLPSKLPRKLSEVLWDGVTHVIVKKDAGLVKFTSLFGREPKGVAKIAIDLHGHEQIFMAMSEDGVHILYDYLQLKYVPPAPPKAPVPSKPPAPAKPPTPVAEPAVSPPPSTPAAQAKPTTTTVQAAPDKKPAPQ